MSILNTVQRGANKLVQRGANKLGITIPGRWPIRESDINNPVDRTLTTWPSNLGIAATCNYRVEILQGDRKIDKDEKDAIQGAALAEVVVTGTLRIPTYQVVNIPDNSFRFSNGPDVGYLVCGEVPNLEPVVIKFWDYVHQPTCAYLMKIYNEQTDKNGMLIPGYNCHEVRILDNATEIKLFDCAIGRVQFEQASAQSALKLYSVAITYEDYDIKVLSYAEVAELRSNPPKDGSPSDGKQFYL